MRSLLALSVLLAGCGRRPVEAGEWVISQNDDGSLHIEHTVLGSVLEDVRLIGGSGASDVDMQFGAFQFVEEVVDPVEHDSMVRVRGRRSIPTLLELRTAKGESAGLLTIAASGGALILDWTPDPGLGKAPDRQVVSGLAGISARCDRDDHFMGLGSHAFDIDHVGEAFTLWVQEPGIGKNEDEDSLEGWPLTGARHDTSFPVPALVRPHRGQALVVDETSRVDVDLCKTDPKRFEVVAWKDGTVRMIVLAEGTALGAIQAVAQVQGTLELPPPWAFGPWNDAIRGEGRVYEVADRLRAFGASSTAIWTEDWKGGEDTANGYRLKGEWTVDTSIYPDAAGQAAALEAQGFHWMAYFSPFLIEGTAAFDEALADGAMLLNDDGTAYTWPGVTFEPTSMVDLSSSVGREWARQRMQAALDLGFDGWMADFAEWLPVDANLASGQEAFQLHNAYPLLWQDLNRELTEGTDAVFFVRSGWLGTGGLVPVVWGGDQRTDFQTDDGFPTVLPLGLGLAASGVPVFTHDIAGYNSVGNPNSDKELWFRWASLGAYSPVMRTHHGAFDDANWQFDTDDETTEHWVDVTRTHAALWPYRYGLAARAADDGTPMLLPIGVVYDEPYDRTDVWLLGEGMLVAPVLERGASGRDVTLPSDVRWWTWPDLAPAQSGMQAAGLDEIPVFVAEGTTIPVFVDPPDTFVESGAVDPGLRTLAEADAERIVHLVGGGGDFTEGDGTRYDVSGSPTGSGEVTQTLASGTVKVAGVTVQVDGSVERTYTFIVTN